MENDMRKINEGYLKYIAKEKQDEMHQSLLRDIYYFYHGIKPKEVLQKNGNRVDVSKENLYYIA